MKSFNIVIFTILYTLINTQVPSGKVLNSCGKRDYEMPASASECKADYGYCCFIKMNVKDYDGTYVNKTFCASSPSDIKLKDVKDDIDDYTNSVLYEISCNNSIYFKLVTWYIALLLLSIF